MAANADTAAILAAIGDVRRSTKAFVAGVSSRKFSEASLRAAQTQARDEQLDRMAKVLINVKAGGTRWSLPHGTIPGCSAPSSAYADGDAWSCMTLLWHMVRAYSQP